DRAARVVLRGRRAEQRKYGRDRGRQSGHRGLRGFLLVGTALSGRPHRSSCDSRQQRRSFLVVRTYRGNETGQTAIAGNNVTAFLLCALLYRDNETGQAAIAGNNVAACLLCALRCRDNETGQAAVAGNNVAAYDRRAGSTSWLTCASRLADSAP